MNQELKLLKLIFDNLDLPVYIIDNLGNTLYANPATFQMYNCSREIYEKYYSNTYYMMEAGSFGGSRETAYNHVLNKKESVYLWHEIVDVNQDSHLYYISQQPIFDDAGNVEFVVGFCLSYSEIKKAYGNATLKVGKWASSQLISGTHNSILYQSAEMERVLHMATQIARTSANLLLLGETGSGKDVVANYVHENSLRAEKEMISVNCATIPNAMFESEMFGYAKGAFTGAGSNGKPGLIELAHQSTLFLDEIDSLPIDQQGKLLRVLETKTIRRIGATQSALVDFRLIAASNKNLSELVRAGKFREDLYYRLNTLTLRIPPLRSRTDDIRPLANHFLRKYCAEYEVKLSISEKGYRQLEQYLWPGNIRQLKHVIEHAVLLSEISDTQNIIQHFDLSSESGIPAVTAESPVSESLRENMDAYEKRLIEEALIKYKTPTMAAKKLDISLPTISRKMAKYGLSK